MAKQRRKDGEIQKRLQKNGLKYKISPYICRTGKTQNW